MPQENERLKYARCYSEAQEVFDETGLSPRDLVGRTEAAQKECQARWNDMSRLLEERNEAIFHLKNLCNSIAQMPAETEQQLSNAEAFLFKSKARK